VTQHTELPRQALWVDALLGTGVQGPPRGSIAELIHWLNHQAHGPRLAIDCPTGLDANTGAVANPDCVLSVDHTLCMIGRKRGLYTGQGLRYGGQVHCAELDAADTLPETQMRLLSAAELRWPTRHLATHKGEQGHVVVVGGEQGLWGAGILSAEAALIAGAGRVSAYVHSGAQAALLARAPEVMTPPQRVPSAWEAGQVLVLGPGLGRSQHAEQRLGDALSLAPEAHCVLDADALWHLPNLAAAQRNNWVLTPHPGEAARLLHTTVATIEADRFAAAAAIQARWGGVVVLKGAGTVVCDSQQLRVLPMASSALATSGLGDVLAGVIGALLAQGLTPFDAACSAVYWVTETAFRRGSTQPVVRATEVLSNLSLNAHTLGYRAQQTS
jgi:NAD(P)H-hydrate epimerase